MSKIAKMIRSRLVRLWQLRWRYKILILFVLVVIAMGGSIVVTSQSSFCNSCHIMNSYYASWETSTHSDVDCVACHLRPGLVGYAAGKINGLAQAVDCVVGRVGTKPNAKVFDVSCLRSECHSKAELVDASLDFGGVKFTHGNHIDKTVDGIEINCGSCHNHLEGEEHFSVSADICFTCHFLEDSDDSGRVVQTTCQSCHEVPDKTIERGLVSINHAEFVSYKANCEDSCHKKQVEIPSDVPDTVCLNCHNYTKEVLADSRELHEKHNGHEKVECFACHGKVTHGKAMGESVTTMMDCKSCHSETHNVQAGIYEAKGHLPQKDDDRVLSPMFLTHVECTGCHIEPSLIESDSLGSLGTVTRAVTEACDECHEAGTGERYIPFWQGQIKALHKQVSENLRSLEKRTKSESDPQLKQQIADSVKQAQLLLQSVESDGSWGVHNLKYTESMLLAANDIINKAQKN